MEPVTQIVAILIALAIGFGAGWLFERRRVRLLFGTVVIDAYDCITTVTGKIEPPAATLPNKLVAYIFDDPGHVVTDEPHKDAAGTLIWGAGSFYTLENVPIETGATGSVLVVVWGVWYNSGDMVEPCVSPGWGASAGTRHTVSTVSMPELDPPPMPSFKNSPQQDRNAP